MAFYTYIMASGRNGTLYAGSTDDIWKRAAEHREKAIAGFTSKYGVKVLVWYEVHPSRKAAFIRERRIKEWRRSWKLMLIESVNPDWQDLAIDPEPIQPGSPLDQRDLTPASDGDEPRAAHESERLNPAPGGRGGPPSGAGPR